MFCPQCGQQSSDEIRFCPRCGLSLVPHAALLAAGNTTAVGPAGVQAPARTRKQISSRRAAKLMFFSVAFAPVFFAFSIAADGAEPMLVPFFMFLVGLTWLVYTRLFADDHVRIPQHPSRKDLRAGADRPALETQQFVPASSFGQQRANTAEMAPPPSVTENTTTLLDRDA